MKKKAVTLFILTILLALFTTVAFAQEGDNVNKGSIRGNVYWDANFDGGCDGENDKPLSGVTINFLRGGVQAVQLETGEDGTYGLVAAEFGEWTINVEAPSGYRILGVTEHAVNIVGGGGSSEVVVGVNFCMAELGQGGGGSTGGNTGNNPASGPWPGANDCGPWYGSTPPARCTNPWQSGGGGGGAWQPSGGNTTQQGGGAWPGANDCGPWGGSSPPPRCTNPTASSGGGNSGVLLPATGNSNNNPLQNPFILLAFGGLTLLLAGFGIEWQRRR